MRLTEVGFKEFVRYLCNSKGFKLVSCHGDHYVYKKNGLKVSIPYRARIYPEQLRQILHNAQIDRNEFLKDWYKI
jgi:predicted RNA binding protein YcfA (HicA-like mRNA interferase family)